ncbi:hypothetical protein AWB72_05483 [Caballeronia concitans]|uniref:Uncharacterized protein n=1 Tax=Caballeronia concitans TaxID=1777133 RepID=A0A658R5X2_9BURK|nr:hypothetical protein AWB72_05483 [Caballeronia concitans]
MGFLPLRFPGHRHDEVLDLLPEARLKVTSCARRGMASALARERHRIASKVTSLHQPREHGVQDDNRLALTGRREPPVERPPARVAARMFATAPGYPRGGGLRVGEELLVAKAVFMGQRGKGPFHRDDGPKQQSLDFLAIGLEGGFRIGEARQPGANGIQIVIRRDLRTARRGSVRSSSAVETCRDSERFERCRQERR